MQEKESATDSANQAVSFLVVNCGVYNFTGGSTGDAKTFQVNFFRNDAPNTEPGLDRDFTLALQDLINNQTNLSLTDRNEDLVYEGEIIEFSISPMTATVNQTADGVVLRGCQSPK